MEFSRTTGEEVYAPLPVDPPERWPFGIAQQPRRRPLAGWWLLILAMTVVPFSMVIYIAALDYTIEVGGNLAVVLIVLAIAILAAAIAGTPGIVRFGRRLLSRNAIEVLARDPRPPVFMLRSFDDDCLLNPINPFHLFFSRFGERYEEALARSLSKIGPPISIGLPGTPKLELGSARLFVATPDWQIAITYFLLRAGVVTITVGRTEGVWWEITQALRRVPLDRLLFFFPYVREQSKQRSPWRIRDHLLLGGAPAIRNFSCILKRQSAKGHKSLANRKKLSFPHPSIFHFLNPKKRSKNNFKQSILT